MKSFMLSIITLMVIAVSTASLIGCASRSDTGLVAGGVVGGVAGSAITGGSTAGTIGGAVGGALIGREVARRSY